MRNLIINADDFGLSSGVNRGIVEAHDRGVVTSTSLMVLAPAAAEAAALASERPELSLGLHFVEDGSADLDVPQQVVRTFAQQLDRFRELTGKDPTHVDSHHHVHTTRERPAVFAALVAPLGVPLRLDGRIHYIGGFFGQWEAGLTDLSHLSVSFLLHLVEAEVTGEFTELACHPAHVVGDFDSSYLQERAVELETLTTPGLREEIESRGVRLTSFRNWRD